MGKYGVDLSKIDRIVCGRKYSAVMLKNGNIGVCSNLLSKLKVEIRDWEYPDLNNNEHRIILNAYFNAVLNYSESYEKTADIFDVIDFNTYGNIIMVGFFRPLLEKFERNNIRISVFDMMKENYKRTYIKDEMEYLNKADAVILTATSIFNKTFMNTINKTRGDCDIFLLGPFATMSRDMFKYKGIKMIFGAIFKKRDERVLNTISNGGGTRKFLMFGSKVYINVL